MGNRKSDKVDKVGGKTNYSFLGGVSPGNFVVSLYLFLYVKYSLVKSYCLKEKEKEYGSC